MRTRTYRALASTLVALAAACGGSEASDPLVACGANGSCPSGFVCASDNTCWRPPLPPAPGTPQNVKAARNGDGSITVSWDAVARATSYLVVRSSQPGSPTSLPSTTQTSVVDKTAVRTQGYSYAVSAIGRGGSSPGSAPAGVAAAPAPPPPPFSIVATPFARHIQLAWSTGFNDVGIFRSTSSGGPYTRIATLLASFSGFFDDTGLADGTTYFYVLQGFASDGFPGNRSVEVSAKTAPAPPANMSVKLIPFSTRITVSWDPVPGADGYCVKLFGPGTCSFPTTTATTFESTVGAQTTVEIRVRAVNAIPGQFGVLLESVDAGPLRITTPPFAPFPALVVDGATSTLSWTPNGASSFAIFRSLDVLSPLGDLLSSDFKLIGTTADASFTDNGPFEPWSQYSYEVASVDANGNGGDPSLPVSRQIAGPADQENLGTAPLAVTRVDGAHDAGQTFVVGQSGVLVGLELSTDGTLSTAILDVFNGPQLLYSMPIGFPFGPACCEPLADGLPGTSFAPIETFLRPVFVSEGQVLRFRLRTFSGGSMDVGRSTDAYAAGSFFTAGSAVPGTDLAFKTFVKPVTGPFTADRFPAAFPGVRRVALAWNGSPGATSYSVQRSPFFDGPFREIANTRQTNVVDAPLTPGSRSWYRVEATGPGGITATSAPIETGPLASDVDQANAGDGSGSVLVNDATLSYAAQSVTIGQTGILGGLQFTALAAESGVMGQVPATIVVRDDAGALLLQQAVTLNLEGGCGAVGCGVPALDPASPTLQTVDLSASRLPVTAGEVLHFEVHSGFLPLVVGDSADLYPGGTESVNGVPIPGRDLAFQVLVQ